MRGVLRIVLINLAILAVGVVLGELALRTFAPLPVPGGRPPCVATPTLAPTLTGRSPNSETGSFTAATTRSSTRRQSSPCIGLRSCSTRTADGSRTVASWWSDPARSS